MPLPARNTSGVSESERQSPNPVGAFLLEFFLDSLGFRPPPDGHRDPSGRPGAPLILIAAGQFLSLWISWGLAELEQNEGVPSLAPALL